MTKKKAAKKKKTNPLHSPSYMARIGAKGGKATKRKRGSKYFSELAKRSHPKNNPDAKRGAYTGGRPIGSSNGQVAES